MWTGWIVGRPGDAERLRAMGVEVHSLIDGEPPSATVEGWHVSLDDAALARLGPLWGRAFWWGLHREDDLRATDGALTRGVPRRQ